MDSFFGIGLPELIFILIIAGIVMGPHRIREVARWLGRMTAQLQTISRTFTQQLNHELDAADSGGEMRAAMDDVRELQRQVADLKRELLSVATAPLRETQVVAKEAQDLLSVQSILPPSLANGKAPMAPASLPSPKSVEDDPE